MAMRATKIQSVKAEGIADLKNKIGDAKDFIFTEYRGLTVEQISALRRQLRAKNADFHVVKNNFARIAFEELGFTKDVEPVLAGPTAVAFSSR
jgi:large subunit ribosomal protein L10